MKSCVHPPECSPHKREKQIRVVRSETHAASRPGSASSRNRRMLNATTPNKKDKRARRREAPPRLRRSCSLKTRLHPLQASFFTQRSYVRKKALHLNTQHAFIRRKSLDPHSHPPSRDPASSPPQVAGTASSSSRKIAQPSGVPPAAETSWPYPGISLPAPCSPENPPYR